MGFRLWYEARCEFCGCAQHFKPPLRQAVKQARDYGNIVTRDNRFFCGNECYNGYKKDD